MMSRSALVLTGLCALALSACSPQTFTMNVDMRYPSKSGIDLSRKTMSIVYMDDGTADSTFNNSVASSLARSLEADYFGGREAIGVYKVPADSVSLDLMHSLVMDTGDDVVFLIGPPVFGEVDLSGNVAVPNPTSVDSAYVTSARIPYNASLFVYDSMDREDRLQSFRGGSILRTPVYSNGVTAREFLMDKALKSKDAGAELVGRQLSNRFLPTWKTEGYSLYWFDGLDDDWTEALGYAYEHRWNKAVDIWTGHVGGRNSRKQACACYNLALAFYMMGDLPLAVKWLDRADSLDALALSPGLRKRIEARK